MKGLILNGINNGPTYDFLNASICTVKSDTQSIVQLVEYRQRDDSFKVDINGRMQIPMKVTLLESYDDTMYLGIQIIRYDTESRTFVFKAPNNVVFELNLNQMEKWIELLYY